MLAGMTIQQMDNVAIVDDLDAALAFSTELGDDQLADYGPWFDNHRRLRELVAELEALSLDIVEADPRWNR
jgi:hypothetical protein